MGPLWKSITTAIYGSKIATLIFCLHRAALVYAGGVCVSLLSPPGKMERSRADFLFFSSGAMGSGLELCREESRELLLILSGGAGGFSSISPTSDMINTQHGLEGEGEREGVIITISHFRSSLLFITAS